MNDIKYKILEMSQEDMKKVENTRRGEKDEKENVDSLRDAYYGITYTDNCIIYLWKDLPEERKYKTLRHEFTHAYINEYVSHLQNNYSEEDVCDIAANSYPYIEEIIKRYKVFKEENKEN